MKSAKPRVIVIMGAATGVGRDTAKIFAETEGAHIGLPTPFRGLTVANQRKSP